MKLIRILVYSCAKSSGGTNMSSSLPHSTLNAAPKLRNYKPTKWTVKWPVIWNFVLQCNLSLFDLFRWRHLWITSSLRVSPEGIPRELEEGPNICNQPKLINGRDWFWRVFIGVCVCCWQWANVSNRINKVCIIYFVFLMTFTSADIYR